MKIDVANQGGSTLLSLEGRLDREWAEYLSDTLESLLQEGVRSLRIDFSRVTYVSSAATAVLMRWREELAILRGDVHLTALSPTVREVFTVAGWDSSHGAPHRPGSEPDELRRSSWHARADFLASGQYELSSAVPAGTLTCRLHGDPHWLTRTPANPEGCSVVNLPQAAFGVGIGGIGGSYPECHERFGELIAVGGCVAYFPSDGARKADYLVGGSGDGPPPRAVLASGLVCEGGFSQLIRFSTRPEAQDIPLSELANIGLDATGGKLAGLVIAGESAGLSGVRLRRSPTHGVEPLQWKLPELRDWLLFAPERTHAMTTTVIAGVVARSPEGPIAAHLRPLAGTGKLYGHLHAAVFSYYPLPQRTVELTDLLKVLFTNHQLRDVLHLIWDDRGEAGVGESALLRGVAWVAPITKVC